MLCFSLCLGLSCILMCCFRFPYKPNAFVALCTHASSHRCELRPHELWGSQTPLNKSDIWTVSLWNECEDASEVLLSASTPDCIFDIGSVFSPSECAGVDSGWPSSSLLFRRLCIQTSRCCDVRYVRPEPSAARKRFRTNIATNGFLPVWSRTRRLRLTAKEKVLEHREHLWDFSPVWVRKCEVRFALQLKCCHTRCREICC